MNHFTLILELLMPATVLAIIVVKSNRVWRGKLAAAPTWKKGLAVLGFACAVLFGGEKPGPNLPSEIVEILSWRESDGGLNDVSGKVVSGIQIKALDHFVNEQHVIVNSASNVIEQARLDCIALTNKLLTTDYRIVYVSYDVPRGTPDTPNHNIMVNWEKVEQTPSNITCYAWFSLMPETNVNIYAQYSIRENENINLVPLTNSWPTTYNVGGVDCVKYVYAIPSAISGVTLKPDYEVKFGGYAPGEYLKVPEDGVIVTTNGVDVLPFTGYKTMLVDTNQVTLRIAGGIVTELTINGVTYKGINPL